MKTPVWFKPAPPGDYDPALANYELHEDGSDWPALAWKVRDLVTATEIAKRINAHDALVAALTPFVEYEKIRRTMGRPVMTGDIWATESISGRAAITAEDMAAATAALTAARGE